MSCGTCGIQASDTLQEDTGVPAGAPTTARRPRCPHCKAFVTQEGGECHNPRCPSKHDRGAPAWGFQPNGNLVGPDGQPIAQLHPMRRPPAQQFPLLPPDDQAQRLLASLTMWADLPTEAISSSLVADCREVLDRTGQFLTALGRQYPALDADAAVGMLATTVAGLRDRLRPPAVPARAWDLDAQGWLWAGAGRPAVARLHPDHWPRLDQPLRAPDEMAHRLLASVNAGLDLPALALSPTLWPDCRLALKLATQLLPALARDRRFRKVAQDVRVQALRSDIAEVLTRLTPPPPAPAETPGAACTRLELQGQQAVQAGDYLQAAWLYQQAAATLGERFQNQGQRLDQCYRLVGAADAAALAGNDTLAHAFYRTVHELVQAVPRQQRYPNPLARQNHARALQGLADQSLRYGNHADAAHYYSGAQELHPDTPRNHNARCLFGLATVAVADADWTRAQRLYDEAAQEFVVTADFSGAAMSLYHRALLAQVVATNPQAGSAEAEDYLRRALRFVEADHDRSGMVVVTSALTDLLRARAGLPPAPGVAVVADEESAALQARRDQALAEWPDDLSVGQQRHLQSKSAAEAPLTAPLVAVVARYGDPDQYQVHFATGAPVRLDTAALNRSYPGWRLRWWSPSRPSRHY